MKLQILILFLCPLLLAKSYSLKEIVGLTLQNSKEIKETSLIVEKAKNDLSEAKDIWMPKVDLTAFAAPIWETTGNAIKSEDNYSNWGIFTGAEVTMIQPIFLWGMNSNLKKAAKNGVEVAQSQSSEKRNLILKRVIEYYYHNLLAKKLLDLASSTNSKLEKVEEHLENKGKSRDLIKFKMKRNLLRDKLKEAELAYELTKRALRFYTQKEDLDLEENLKLLPFIATDKDHFTKKAIENNPQLKQLSHGLVARHELIRGGKEEKTTHHLSWGKGKRKVL